MSHINRRSFMAELKSLLAFMDTEDRARFLCRYERMFDEAGPDGEDDLIRKLGSPVRQVLVIEREYREELATGIISDEPEDEPAVETEAEPEEEPAPEEEEEMLSEAEPEKESFSPEEYAVADAAEENEPEKAEMPAGATPMYFGFLNDLMAELKDIEGTTEETTEDATEEAGKELLLAETEPEDIPESAETAETEKMETGSEPETDALAEDETEAEPENIEEAEAELEADAEDIAESEAEYYESADTVLIGVEPEPEEADGEEPTTHAPSGSAPGAGRVIGAVFVTIPVIAIAVIGFALFIALGLLFMLVGLALALCGVYVAGYVFGGTLTFMPDLLLAAGGALLLFAFALLLFWMGIWTAVGGCIVTVKLIGAIYRGILGKSRKENDDNE